MLSSSSLYNIHNNLMDLRNVTLASDSLEEILSSSFNS